jgi:hypothetical protein
MVKLGKEMFRSLHTSIHTKVIVCIILIALQVLGATSSIASLITYPVPAGSEYTSWHSYWALIPAVFTPLLILAMALATMRNIKTGAHYFGFYWCIFHLAVFLTIFVVTMVDIFSCDSADWWCFDGVTGNVSWRYWWYAASSWFQTLTLAIWLIVYALLHGDIKKIRNSDGDYDLTSTSMSSLGVQTPAMSSGKQESTPFIKGDSPMEKILYNSHHLCVLDFLHSSEDARPKTF